MTDTDRPSFLARLRSRPSTALGALALLAVGGGAGAVVVQATRPSVSMAPVSPVAIRSLSSSGIVTIKGRVAEIYGKAFVMADASGRALVDTGREGEGGTLVTAGEAVTVQGRFDGGIVHAAFLVGPDNKVVVLGPLRGPHDRPGRHGPERGPGRDAPPPPPAAGTAPQSAAPAAPAPTPG